MPPTGAISWAVTGALLAALVLVLTPFVVTHLPRSGRQSVLRLLRGLGVEPPGAVAALTPRVEFVAEEPVADPAAAATFVTLVGDWLRGAPFAETEPFLDVSPRHTSRPRDLVGAAPARSWSRWLVRPDRVLVRAHLHPVAVRGGGVSLRVTELDGRTLAAGTIWNDEPAPDDAVAAQWLAPRAAAWLSEVLCRQAPVSVRRSALAPAGAEVPRYAAFLAGVEATAGGRFDAAAAAFNRAASAAVPDAAPATRLAQDAARIDECFARLCTGADRDREAAIVTLLQLTDEQTVRWPAGGTHALRARVHLVTGLLDSCAAGGGAGDPSTVHEALVQARALALDVLAPGPDQAAQALREQVRAGVLLLLARAAALRCALKQDEPERSHLRGAGTADLTGAAAPDAAEQLLALVGLIDPERADDEPLRRPVAEDEPETVADRLVRAVVELLPLPPDARYGLACYLAQTNATVTLPEHLEAILASPLLAARARHDPILAPYAARQQLPEDTGPLTAAARRLLAGEEIGDEQVGELLELLRRPAAQGRKLRELTTRFDAVSAGLARLQEAHGQQHGLAETAAGRARDRDSRLEQRVTALEQGQQRTATHISGLAGRVEATSARQDRLDVAASRAMAAAAELKVLTQRVEVLARKVFGTRAAPREIDLRDGHDGEAVFPPGWFRTGGRPGRPERPSPPGDRSP